VLAEGEAGPQMRPGAQDAEAALSLEHPVLPAAFWEGSLSAGQSYWEQGGGYSIPLLGPSSDPFAVKLG